MAGRRRRWRPGALGHWPSLQYRPWKSALEISLGNQPCKLALGKHPTRADHEIVAVDHLRTSADAEDSHHIRRRAALDLLGVIGVIGDEPAADLMGVGAAHHHRVATGELPIDP